MGDDPHVLVVPYPAQGHVIPLMELAHCLAQHEIRVTFVNSYFTQERVTESSPEKNGFGEDSIRLVSISDGLDPSEDRNELGNLSESIFRVMPEKLEELIKEINGSEGDQVACVIADISMGWVMDVAAKMGIRRAAFGPTSAAILGLIHDVPKLMEDGIINDDDHHVHKNRVAQPSVGRQPTMCSACRRSRYICRSPMRQRLASRDSRQLHEVLM